MIQGIWRIFAAINFPPLKHKSCEPMRLCFLVHLEELRYIRASAIPVISPCFPDSAAIQSVLPGLFWDTFISSFQNFLGSLWYSKPRLTGWGRSEETLQGCQWGGAGVDFWQSLHTWLRKVRGELDRGS